MMIFIAASIVSCLAFAVLTLDVGMIALTKIQLQNAADAAALAAASALSNGDEDEATRRAIAVAGENLAWQDGLQPVVIVDGDVTFPTSTRTRVETHRTRATGDALRTFFIGVINPGSDRLADARAVAEAEIYDVCGGSCFMPFAPVDRFTDVNSNGHFDPGDTYDPLTTGYRAPDDIGRRVTLKRGNGNNHYEPSSYFLICLCATNCGGSDIRDDIENCSDCIIRLGDILNSKHGGTVGPVRDGVRTVIARDPGAYWDNASDSVQGSAFGTSPRVVKIALFDPRSMDHQHVTVSNLGAFFLESVDGNSRVTGVYMGLITQGEPCEDTGEPTFLSGLHLVR